MDKLGTSVGGICANSDEMSHEGGALECAVCLSQLCEPVRWPASPDATCTHSFCWLCAYKVLRYKIYTSNAEEACTPTQPRCPICRTPAIDGAQWGGEAALVLDAELQRRVLSCDSEAHRKQQIAHRAEFERMHADEFRVALHPLGEYVLRKGQKIELHLSADSLGWVAQALTSPRRNFGLVLAHVVFPGVPARSATLCGFPWKTFDVKSALAELQWKMRGTDVLKVEVRIGKPLHVLSQPSEEHQPSDASHAGTSALAAWVREEADEAPPSSPTRPPRASANRSTRGAPSEGRRTPRLLKAMLARLAGRRATQAAATAADAAA